MGTERSDDKPQADYVPWDLDAVKQEIFDLFARYGSGNYMPTEEEKDILNTGLDEILTPPPVAPSAVAASFVPWDLETVKQEIRDLFARYGSGDYTPSEEEKEIIENALDEILTPPPVAQSATGERFAQPPAMIRTALLVLLGHIEPGWDNCKWVVQEWIEGRLDENADGKLQNAADSRSAK